MNRLRRVTAKSELTSSQQRRAFGGGLWAALTSKVKSAPADHTSSASSCVQGADGGGTLSRASTVEVSEQQPTPNKEESKIAAPEPAPTSVSSAGATEDRFNSNTSTNNVSSSPSPSSAKKAFLAGRKSVRSPLFETHTSNNNGVGGGVVAVEGVSSTANKGHASFSFPSTTRGSGSGRSTLVAPNRGTAPPRTIVIETKNGGLMQGHKEGDLAAAIVSDTEEGGAMSPFREGVLDSEGNKVLTREALIAQRIANSKRELKEAVEQIVPTTMGKSARSSSVRYKVDVRQGQHRYTMELMKVIRAKKDPSLTIEEAIHTQCDFLNARERLDLLRMASRTGGAVKKHKRINKKSSTPTKRLPMYFSPEFKRNFYFREEDITEKSALGHGPGGQAANRRMQTIHIKHVPTGIAVRYSHFPSLYANRKAARIILSLKVEERELGSESQLGRMAAERKAKKERQAVARHKLQERSANIMRKVNHRHPFLGFLHGMFPLGASVVPKCETLGTAGERVAPGSTSNNRSQQSSSHRPANSALMVSALFDAHANRWWNILSESFYNHWCRPPTVKTFVRTSDNTMATRRRVCGWPIGANHRVPGWFCYFFPIVCKQPPPLERPSKEIMRLAGSTRTGSEEELSRIDGRSAGRSRRGVGTRRGLAKHAVPDVLSSAVPMRSSFVLKDTGSHTYKDTGVSAPCPPTPNASLSLESSSTSPSSWTADGGEKAAEGLVDALLTQAATQENALEEETRRAKEVFFEYLKQKKKYDVVARTVQYHEDQLAQMKALPEGRKAVRNAINAVVEVFGLRVICKEEEESEHHQQTSSSHNGIHLDCFTVKTDGPNWKQFRERLCTPDRQHVTPLGAAVFPHMIVSLARLDMGAESKGLRKFFSERAARDKKQYQWAVEMISLIEEAEAEAEATPVATPTTLSS